MSATTTKPQTNCRITTLPRELRGIIYEHVFTATFEAKSNRETDGEDDKEEDAGHNKAGHHYIPLDETAIRTAPPVDLALTCRLFHQEAIELHQASYRAYWAENTFSTAIHCDMLALDESAITPKHIQHVKRIAILKHGQCADYLHLTERKDDDGGGYPWQREGQDGDDYMTLPRVPLMDRTAAVRYAKKAALDEILRKMSRELGWALYYTFGTLWMTQDLDTR